MSFKRANCGGIIIDDETIVEENGVLKAVSSGGTDVVANPTLAGTEADLTGLQVGDTKYKIPEGGGGGALFIVTVGDGDVCDASYADATSAFEAGKVVMLKVPANPTPDFYYLSGYLLDEKAGCTVTFGEGGSQLCSALYTNDPLHYQR